MLINSAAVRVTSFLLVGGLLAASLFGFHQTWTVPSERQVSIPVVNYQQQGRFHYTVYLKPSTLFATTELGPGQIYFARLVDNISMTFSYRFSSDQPLEEADFAYKATATFGSPGLWERQFVLIPPTTATQANFSFSFNRSTLRL